MSFCLGYIIMAQLKQHWMGRFVISPTCFSSFSYARLAAGCVEPCIWQVQVGRALGRIGWATIGMRGQPTLALGKQVVEQGDVLLALRAVGVASLHIGGVGCEEALLLQRATAWCRERRRWPCCARPLSGG